MAASSVVVEHRKGCLRLGIAMTKCSNQGISMRPCIEKPCFILMSEVRSEGCCLPAHLRSVIIRPPRAVGIDDVLKEIHVVTMRPKTKMALVWEASLTTPSTRGHSNSSSIFIIEGNG